MKEAIEIAKLRLFLKLVATVDVNLRKANFGLEPLPDIDFNIRAGNTLVGFATESELKSTLQGKLFSGDGKTAEERLSEFNDEFTLISQSYTRFQNAQLINNLGTQDFRTAKIDLNQRLKDLNKNLNKYLAANYGIDAKLKPEAFRSWLETHQPFHWIAEFYQIVAVNGGFDVIIGNPPYVESSKASYTLLNYNTAKCGNLYAYVMERTKAITHNHSTHGMIVPLSGHSTSRMSELISTFYKSFKSSYLYNLSGDANPSKLFDGVKFRLVIYLTSNALEGNYTSQYKRWYASERESLFSCIEYNKHNLISYPTAIPKVPRNIYLNIVNKINRNRSSIALNQGSTKIYYHNTPVNWIRSHSFIPYFKSERDGVKISSQLKTLNFITEKNAKATTCILNSSLFFIWWLVNSDCYHLNNSELLNFKFDYSNSNSIEELSSIEEELMQDLKLNSVRRVYNYRTSGRVEYDEYYMKQSKFLIDLVDSVLAQHYGFTEEELDFIINYDIKYRMGKALYGEEDEEEVELEEAEG